MAGKYTYRLTSEGFAEFEAEMKALGDAGVAAFDKIKAKMPEFADAAEKARQRAADAKKQLEDLARTDFRSLQASLDPVIAAQQQFARGRDTVTTAQKLGVSTDAEAAAAIRQLEERYAHAASGVTLFSQGLGAARELLGAFGIALGVGEVVRFGVEVFKSTAALDNNAKTLGVNVEFYQALRAAALNAGASVDVVDTNVQRFTRSLGEAIQNGGPAAKAFTDLHLTARDLAGGTEAALPKVASALLAIGTAQERARIEAVLFGKTGQDLEQVLRQWADPEIVQHMKDMGLVIDHELVSKAAEADRQWGLFFEHLKVWTASALFGSWSAPQTPQERQEFLTRDTAKPFKFPFAGPDSLAILNSQPKPPAKPDVGAQLLQQRLASMQEEARLAGLTAQERKIELETITLAQAVQQKRGVDERNIVQTFEAARKIVGETTVEQLRQNALTMAENEALAAKNDRLATAGGWNDQLLRSLEAQARADTAATVQQGIKGDSAKTEYDIHKNVRALNENEYLAEQVRLASILPEQRAAELYILQQKLQLNKKDEEIDKESIRNQFEQIRQAQQLTDRIEEFRNTTRDGLKNLFLNGKLDAKSFLDSLRDGWATTLADMAERALLQPIEIPLVLSMQQGASALAALLGFGGGSGGDGSAALTGVNNGPSIFGAMQRGVPGIGQPPLSNSLLSTQGQGGFTGGYGTVGKVINQPLYGIGGVFGGSGTPSDSTIGSALGGAAQGYGIGSIYGQVAGLSPGKAQNAQIGGAIGGAIGTAVGGPIGGIIGSTLGSIVGGLFGPGKSNYTATANFSASQTAATFTGDKPNDNTVSASKTAAQAIIAEIANLKGYGVSFTDTISQINIGQRDKSTYVLGSGAKGAVGTVGDVNDLAIGALRALLGSSTSSSPTLKSVLANNKFSTVDELDSAAKFVTQIYDATVAAKPAATQTETAMKNLVQSFKDASTQAKSLGLDVGALAAGTKKSFDQDIRGAILQIQDPLKYALELWQRDAQARLDAAAQLGGDIDQVKQLNALLYQQTTQQAASGITGGLQDLINSLKYGSASAEAPDKQYFAALQDYNAARTTALASGSPTDIQNFQARAQSFLPIARDYLGTSERYGSYTSDVMDTATSLLQRLNAPSSMPDLTPMVAAQNATTQQTAAVVDAVKDNSSRLDQITQQLSTMNGVLAALGRRVVARGG
ncbi:MAG TPA: hypothetical protein VGF92_03870 [Stellaceae bacterium]